MNYQIKPVAIDGYADADGVHENNAGAWLGTVDWVESDDGDYQTVLPYADEDLDFVSAPANWRELVIKEL